MTTLDGWALVLAARQGLLAPPPDECIAFVYDALQHQGKLDGLMRNFSESGAVTYCAAYHAGVQVDGGCN